jgi:hypothetical protein
MDLSNKKIMICKIPVHYVTMKAGVKLNIFPNHL